MITAFLIALISVLYMLGIIFLLFIEFGLVIVLLFWPILLPVAVGWKIALFIIWLIILLFLGND